MRHAAPDPQVQLPRQVGQVEHKTQKSRHETTPRRKATERSTARAEAPQSVPCVRIGRVFGDCALQLQSPSSLIHTNRPARSGQQSHYQRERERESVCRCFEAEGADSSTCPCEVCVRASVGVHGSPWSVGGGGMSGVSGVSWSRSSRSSRKKTIESVQVCKCGRGMKSKA